MSAPTLAVPRWDSERFRLAQTEARADIMTTIDHPGPPFFVLPSRSFGGALPLSLVGHCLFWGGAEDCFSGGLKTFLRYPEKIMF